MGEGVAECRNGGIEEAWGSSLRIIGDLENSLYLRFMPERPMSTAHL